MMKFYGGVWGINKNKKINFGGNHDLALTKFCTFRVLRLVYRTSLHGYLKNVAYLISDCMIHQSLYILSINFYHNCIILSDSLFHR